MRKFFKRLFCKHNYKQISWYIKQDRVHNTRYSMRIYKCTKCGKQIEVDGRHDKYRKE